MNNPEIRNGETAKSKKPVEVSVFDRPGSLFPGIVRGKPYPDFDQIMKANRRDMAVVLTLGVLALIAGAFCDGNKKK